MQGREWQNAPEPLMHSPNGVSVPTGAGPSVSRDRTAYNIGFVKVAVRRLLFSVSGIEQIHIIGCSRSGTTLLHLAMACFANVVLSESESNVWFPYLLKRVDLALKHGRQPGRKFFVTKRDSGWW